MKDYIKRLREGCSVYTYAFWWLIRLCTIGLIIRSLFDDPFSPVMTARITMNLGIMFVWEICLAMPKWTVFRYIQPMPQTAIMIVDFVAVITAYLFDFYYEVRWWDSFLHFVGGVGIVFLGYEFACALIRKERKTATLSLILLCSVGFSFMCTTLWEIFEFCCDQVVGVTSDMAGNSQFWSLDMLQGTDKAKTILEYIDINRYPVMDTMGDMIMNVSGALLGTAVLRIYPYRHKGRFKLDFLSE